MVLKVWSGYPWGYPRFLQESMSSNDFYNNTKMSFVLITLILSRLYGAVFQRLRDMEYHSGLK